MSLNELSSNMLVILPVIVVVAWACLLLLVDLAIPKGRKSLTALLAALGLLAAILVTILQAAGGRAHTTGAFNGMITVDGFSIYLSLLLYFSGLAGIALAYDYLKRTGLERGEYYVLLLFSISGMALMTQAADLIVVFLALELLSIPLYVMAGIAAPRPESEEAGLKYFLLGAFASSFVVYGVALTFGATANTSLAGIVESIDAGSASLVGLTIGAAFILVGLGFKVAVVPFHMWTPDVYQGAPSSVTGFMSVGAKVAGFAALLRVFVLSYPSLADDLAPVFWGIAALTMIVGNVVAIAQTNIKRLLAYSSIAHAGYMMMALVPYGHPELAQPAVASTLFYLVGYTLTSFAAWAVVIALEKLEGKGLNLDDYAGLGRKHPMLAAVMTVAMLSFIGIPPTLGFFGKFYLFGVVIAGGYVGLAVIGVLTSLVSAYYYLRVVVFMYMHEGEPEVRREGWLYLTALAAGVGLVLISIFAQPLFEWTAQALLRL
jgi:NADH-quinone oxidoreductase subunit N